MTILITQIDALDVDREMSLRVMVSAMASGRRRFVACGINLPDALVHWSNRHRDPANPTS